jgi:hypothetical protein
MNTRTRIIAAAAVLAALALPTIASAEVTMSYPSSYGWGQIETTGVPGDPRASALGQSRHQLPHGVEPYGQW